MGYSGSEITYGSRINAKERIQAISDRLEDSGVGLRDRIDQRLNNRRVQPANENLQNGTLVGAIGTSIVWALEDYLPARAGADASVSNTEIKQNEIVYTIDSNAIIESQARFRSMIDAGTGVTSLWTDDFDVRRVERVKTRPARDTYRYEIALSD
jgi:hypothetical protein